MLVTIMYITVDLNWYKQSVNIGNVIEIDLGNPVDSKKNIGNPTIQVILK